MIGWLSDPDGKSRPVALLPDGRTAVVRGEHEIVPMREVPRWRTEQRQRVAARCYADLLARVERQLRRERVMLESTTTWPDQPRALAQLGRQGSARLLGARAWALAVPVDDFEPAEDGRLLWVTGSTVVPPGERLLLGAEGGAPVVMYRQPGVVHGVVLTDGRWTEPLPGITFREWRLGVEDELRRASQPDPADVRAAMLGRLRDQFAVVPANDAERATLDGLRRDGLAWLADDHRTYVVA
nr:hypothetical protein [Propionicimonas sp.]